VAPIILSGGRRHRSIVVFGWWREEHLVFQSEAFDIFGCKSMIAP
jgi:hypothetical protein